MAPKTGHPEQIEGPKTGHPEQTLAPKWVTGTNIVAQIEDPEQTLALKIRTRKKPWHSKLGPGTNLGTQNQDPEVYSHSIRTFFLCSLQFLILIVT